MWEKYRAEEQQIKAPDFLKDQIIDQMSAYQLNALDSSTNSVQKSILSRIFLICLSVTTLIGLIYAVTMLRSSSSEREMPVDNQYPVENIPEVPPFCLEDETETDQEIDVGNRFICLRSQETDFEATDVERINGRKIIITPPRE